MHDTFLLKRISESLYGICNENCIARVNKLRIITSQNSHIQQDNLLEHLQEEHAGLVGEWTEIVIERQDMENLTAIIDIVDGETIG